MEVHVNKAVPNLRRWEDGVGNDYVDKFEERERERKREEGKVTEDIMELMGWEWDGEREIKFNKRPRKKEE
ncbi:hypothetical protein TrRE_jg9438 [Triparma retinervis]|uniref:Uncharacterized protein n=1 Tax=Triparma retinervis TaxID=2557542 RepID=A0A9W7FDL1_9STRA|nr:hypothetical protein TrRE_jg9438 [Triparma retinervis]